MAVTHFINYVNSEKDKMYIFKNALRCISRSFGRNILIGIIVLVIATSSCIGLSIRQAAENAREDTLAGMAITATISFDRQSMMGNMGGKGGMGGMGGRGDGGFDRDGFMSAMLGVSSLTLDDYLIYAGAPSVSDFYYTFTCYLDGSESFSPVSTDSDSISDSGEISGVRPGGMAGSFFVKDSVTANYITEISSATDVTVIILADELTGNLDSETENEIMDIFRRLADSEKCVIIVSHSSDVASLCDATYELKKVQKKGKRASSLSEDQSL